LVAGLLSVLLGPVLLGLVLLPAAAGATVEGNPVIVSPAPTDALYEGYTGPFEIDFTAAPAATYSYAVFSDPIDGPTRLMAGPGTVEWSGVGADPHLIVEPLTADPHLRFKITDGAGHEAQLSFAVRPGPAPRCALVVPTKVRVAAPVVKVPGRLSSTCATLDTQTADWKVTHAGQVLDYYRFGPSTTAGWEVFDADPMGSYAILPLSARSSAPADVPQNSPSVSVRRDSRLGIGGSRSGSTVTLRTTLSRYSAGANGFRPWTGTHVVLTYRSCSSCAWQVLRTLTTNLHGQAGYTFHASRARDYRVTSAGTSVVWAALPKYERL
jgi:hypothetical protein